MANETTYTVIADAVTAEVASGTYLRKLAAREALPNHPALLQAESPTPGGSTTIKIPVAGIDGFNTLTATADGDAVAYTEFDFDKVSVTVARQSKAYGLTGLAKVTDRTGLLSGPALAQDAFNSATAQLTKMIAALGAGFSNVVGTSGANASLSIFLDAKRALSVANVPGPYMAILHPVQWGDIVEDLALNAGGALQWDPANADLIAATGSGYQGKLAGVDVFTTTHVPTANAGADRAGFMFGRGAIAWASATPMLDNPSHQILMGDVLFEWERNALSDLTSAVTHYYVGVSEGIDAAGVGIVTDA